MTETKPTAAELHTADVAAILREPFKDSEVGKLPRVVCPKCSDKKNRSGTCDEHPNKEKCPECKAFVSPRHIHIDYVGHADVTSRLLVADPEWNWEPVAADEHGLPVFDTDDEGLPVGMWIRLTVGGVTRLGYGSVPSGQNDAIKVLIGDALRNAAMRFGVALDLWAKGDRADPSAENATASAGQAQRRSRGPRQDDWDNAKPARPGRAQEAPPDGSEWETDGPAPDPAAARWVEGARDAAMKFTTHKEGVVLWREASGLVDAGKLDPADAQDLQALIKARHEDIDKAAAKNGKQPARAQGGNGKKPEEAAAS